MFFGFGVMLSPEKRKKVVNFYYFDQGRRSERHLGIRGEFRLGQNTHTHTKASKLYARVANETVRFPVLAFRKKIHLYGLEVTAVVFENGRASF